LNAAAVPFRDDVPDGPGLHLAALEAGDVALGLSHGLSIELSARNAAAFEIMPSTAHVPVEALDRWLRVVERMGARVPITAPRALFPGRVTLQTGECVAAPRDRVVWVGESSGWTVLTDTHPREWPDDADVEIVTTTDLAKSGMLARGMERWNDATAARLADVAAAEPVQRVRNIAAANSAVTDAAAAARASIESLLVPSARRGPSMADPIARIVTRSAAVIADGTHPVDFACQAAELAGLGARMVAINQPLDGEDGPNLLIELDNDSGRPRIAAARAGALGYAIIGPSASHPVRPGRLRFGTRAIALTEPLSDRLIAALDKPARMLTALTAASPTDTAIALIWGLAGIGTAIAMPAAVNLLFTSVWPRADLSGHWLVIAGLVAITFAGLGFEAARSLRAGRLALRFASMFENGIWLRLVRARPRGLMSGGDTQERFATASHLRGLLGSQPMRFVTDLGMIAAGIAQMIYYGGQLAWIGVGAITLITICCISLMPPATRARTETAELGGRQTALLAQAIAAVTKVKATASENFVLARWAALADRRRTALRRAERMETASTLTVVGISGFATASVFGLAGLALGVDGDYGISPLAQAAPSPEVTLGAFIAFQVSLGQTMGAATSAAGMTALWPALSAAGTRLRPLATLPPETVGQRTAPPPLEGAITISHITHRYPGSDAPSLDDVDLIIAARDYVAIVGASGSGKSTLLRILLGLEQPDHGAVYFDGLDARQLDPAPLRRQIGYVGQDSRLAPGSILDNILDGRRAGAPAAWEAARLAGLSEDIEAMPMGMQTLVGEGGQNISGGQRQRILIARAVLSRPRILIFDEATSALDNRTQAIVQRGLAELPVTRIVVAHRLSTIQEVDRVFVLSKGRLVESGSPAELTRQDGAFAMLAGRQTLGELVRGGG
jgi:ABC-type bacteriocin/lantibiotic exporter with double-glycine peptidase domain